MIDANELRVGSLLYADWKAGLIVAVKEICETKVIVNDNDWSGLKHDEVSPIPLTVECLIKLSFTKYVRAKDYITADENHRLDWTRLQDWTIYCVNLFNFYVGIRDGKFFHADRQLGSDEQEYICPIGVELKSVHELQNRFQSITGEVLTLKTIV